MFGLTMKTLMVLCVWLWSVSDGVLGAYPCLCSYQTVAAVYSDREATSTQLGEMFEFDCMPVYPRDVNSAPGTFTVLYENKVGKSSHFYHFQ